MEKKTDTDGRLKILRYAMIKRKWKWWKCYMWRGDMNRLGSELKNNQDNYMKSKKSKP